MHSISRSAQAKVRDESVSALPDEMSTPASWSMVASITPSRIAFAAIDSMSPGVSRASFAAASERWMRL